MLLTSGQFIGQFFLKFGTYFGPGPTDALLADFRDVWITGLERIALLITGLGKLNHDMSAIASILSIELHQGVGGGSGAGEEVEDETVFRYREPKEVGH